MEWNKIPYKRKYQNASQVARVGVGVGMCVDTAGWIIT